MDEGGIKPELNNISFLHSSRVEEKSGEHEKKSREILRMWNRPLLLGPRRAPAFDGSMTRRRDIQRIQGKEDNVCAGDEEGRKRRREELDSVGSGP